MGRNTWFLAGMGFVLALAVVALGYLFMRGPALRKIEPDPTPPPRAQARKKFPLIEKTAKGSREAPAPAAKPEPPPLPKLGESELAKRIQELLAEYDEIVADVPGISNDADRIATLKERQARLDRLVEKMAALGPDAVPLLAQVIGEGDSRRAEIVGRQTIVIRALARIPGKAALEALGDALRTSDSFTLKMTIVAQLAENAGPAGVEVLSDRLPQETDARVRSRIVNYLGQQKGPKALLTISKEATDDENPNVRIAAIRALGELADPSSAGVLERIARTSDDIGCRQNAIQIDARVVKEQAIPMLQDFLQNDPNLRIKSVAILGLQEVGGASARAALESAANDPSQSEDVRARARGALAMLDRQAASAAGGEPPPIQFDGKIQGLKPLTSGPVRSIGPVGDKR
jgi:HEAT repeat protein